MTPFLETLPLWLSMGFSVVGLYVSIRLARLAYASVLFPFTVLLTVGIVVFGFHHLLELADPNLEPLAKNLEAVASAIFLAAAGLMIYQLRQILDVPKVKRKPKEKEKSTLS